MKNLLKIVPLLFIILISQYNQSQLSKVHYIPPLSTSPNGNNPPNEQWFHISTPSELPVNFTIRRGDGTEFYTDNVTNADPWTARANLSNNNGDNYGYLFASSDETEQLLTQHGFIVEADQEIYVSTRFISQSNNHAGALVSKGESALGTRFRAGALQVGGNGHLNFVSVMATEDNTQVSFNLPDGVPILSGQTGLLNIGPLSRGQSYVIASEGNLNGIIGTLIESTKPIVVNSGSGVGSFAVGTAGGQDFGVDQIVGAELVGSEYIFVRGNGQISWENVLIIADQNNTRINVNGSPHTDGTGNQVVLNEGEFTIIEGDKYVNSNMYVNTDNSEDKLFAFQGMGDIYQGFNGAYPAANQGMVFVPPLSCGTSGNVNNIAEIDRVGEGNGSLFDDNAQVSFVTTKGSTITVNGAIINEADQNVTRNDVLGNDKYESYIITNLSGNIKVESNGEMYVSYYNTNGAASTAGFYSGFTKPPKFDLDITFETKGACINEDGTSNIELNAVGSFASFLWEIKNNDGTFSAAPGNSTTNTYKPTQSGVYRLKGILECDIELNSDEIPISICATDSDNDGIIDNIDLDLDNDGVLNSIESGGKGEIDFTNPESPVININEGLLSGTTVSGVITGIITKTKDDHSITATANGFESQVEAGADQELKYTLNFNEKLNILFKDSGQAAAIVDGESFILKSIPGTTNITLLDPNDNLYVDTDFDGVYEDNTLQYTSNEIRFKFKSRTNPTYEFYSHQIDGIELVHKLNNVGSNSESVLVPSVIVVDYKLDTDGDQILDYNDVDSDDDGCWDVVEAGYLTEDLDGIYGPEPPPDSNLPNITSGTVDARGRIVNDDYDYNIEPKKDSSGQYYFQKNSVAPEINLQPASSIACYDGAPAEFEVNVQTNDVASFLWQLSTDNGATWTDLENNDTYSGVDSSKLTITSTNLGMNGYLFRVKINTDEYACYLYSQDSTKLTVEANLPIANSIDDLIQCDDSSFGDDADGIISGWDFNQKINDILAGNQDLDKLTITFHTSSESANDLNDNGISGTNNFTNENSPNEQEIFVRVRNNDTDCYNAETSFKIIVEPLPTANDVTISRQCDGDAGDESQDGVFPFDTSNIQTTLLAGQTNVTTYYYFKDANNNDVLIGNELPNPFVSGSQIITIQVENNTPQKCYDETTLEFIVDDSPEIYAVVIDSKCDDGPSDTDGYSEFDTSTITQTLLTNPETSQTQSLDLYTIEYEYINENGATVTAAELPNPFNTKTQTVKATVTNKLNGTCVISEDIQFKVDPLPVVKEFITVEQCDNDDDNDGKTRFNLISYENLISEDSENETFEYYSDINFTNSISNPEDFENTVLYNQSVYVKILTDQNCFRESRIDLKIGASQIPNTFVEDNNTKYTVCETSPATSPDGIEIWSSTIFSDINTKLVNSNSKFSEQNITISYYSSKNDALIKKDPIDISQNYTNVNPNTQEIWAFVENNDLTEVSCEGLEKVAELYVEPRPVAYPVTIERQCDGGAGDDSQDGIYPFDTSNIVTTLLTNPDSGVVQDQSILTITYFNEDGSEIPAASFAPTFATASQTITIRVERDPSYPNITNPDGLCYDETTLEFIVDDTPEIYPVVIAPHCDGDDGNDDRDGFDEFDTSTLTADLLGPDQSLDNYEISYLYTDEDGNLLSAPELRNPFNTKTQTVTVTLTNKLNTTCPATATIDFTVNPLPEFTVDDPTIVCLNLPPIPIGVISADAEYTYTWTHTDINGNNTPFPSTEDTILIGVGGIYYVTATTTDGTNCSRTLSIEVEESEIATVTAQDITVEDLTSDNNNTITIDTANLGLGDYEFAIDDPNGPYQNEPFFENVRPGIHTIYIRDKNDCGIAQIDVSVIGYKKFFTPNGDGIHDKWRILGIREDFQPNSRVYIFDRYGKLLKELDPVNEGWDGTYLGRPMPQTDYWFRVFLEDGREFKGHFSLVRGK